MTAVGCVPRIRRRRDYLLVETEVPDELHDDVDRWRLLIAALKRGDQFGLHAPAQDGPVHSRKSCVVWAVLATAQSARSRQVIHEPRRGPGSRRPPPGASALSPH
jgi:hypothetical protein